MKGLLRSESGQVLPLAVVMVLLFSLLVFGSMGAAVAEGIHAKLQAAADSAALAATDQAVLWEQLSVQRHLFACFATKRGWDCRDSFAGPAAVRDSAAQLFPDGWVTDAGCQYAGDGQAGVPPRPDPSVVCDSWQLQQAGFEYPAGSDPQGAAQRYFASNTARLDAHGVPAGLTSVKVNRRTGAVQVAAQAAETGNPLGVLLHGQVQVQVRADVRPHMTGQLQESGP